MIRIKTILDSYKIVGPKLLLKEAIRRIFGIRYSYNGIVVNDLRTFRIIKNAMKNGYVITSIDGNCVLITDYGKLVVPKQKCSLFSISAVENFSRLYGRLNAKSRIVLDVGGYIGDTALYFLNNGARLVIVYEPVKDLFKLLLNNIELNNVSERVVAINAGVWIKDGTIVLPAEESYIKTVSWQSVIKNVSQYGNNIVAKIDCEGCEYGLIGVSCKDLMILDEYIIEIHGKSGPLVMKFTDCGFEAEKVETINACTSIWYFKSNVTRS
ncbi:MAG: FkbM family methyltransferase [Desulfurococcales archaeon]|nr:FkbM family methyltransferase [Desulfurococcales archaeon]MEB3788983.1 FkbM family methyltransferase [Desulfurococcales archaeon]